MVRINSATISPSKDQDIDFKVLKFLCRFFKICCQLKKTKIKGLSKKLTEEVKELESSQDLKNKDIDTIFLQLTGFARFLKIKAEIIHKIKKYANSQNRFNR
jgi:uncharacterized protein YllA (UPF0747 family)